MIYLSADILGAITASLSELLKLAILVSELGVEGADLLSKVTDLLNEFHVLLHDVVIVLFVNLSLLLQALLERVDRVFEVPLLVLVLLLDVGVYLNILDLLLLYVGVEVLVDCTLKLIEIINELNGAVYSVSEALNEYVIGPYLGSVLLDKFLHLLLPSAEIIDNITEISINLVEMLKVLVHVVGLLLETSDFHLTRGDITLKLLDLVVEDELELLEFLSLLLQLIDLLLTISNQLILGRDLISLILDLLLQCLQYITLVSDLDILLLLVSLELLDVALEVLMLVLGQLELCLRLQ